MFKEIYIIVKKIPKGKVATYGQIALRLRSGPYGSRINVSARTVGWALHANSDPKVPCHRVVNIEGRLAPNFAFDGEVEQRRRLNSEGITFKKDRVDLEKHLWKK